MKKRIFILAMVYLLFIPFVFAQECPDGTSTRPGGGGVCFPDDTGLSEADLGTIIGNVMQWLLGILAAFGVIGFVISGMQYLLSAGDDKVMATAKLNMVYCIVGVVVGLAGYIVILAIDEALSGTSTAW